MSSKNKVEGTSTHKHRHRSHKDRSSKHRSHKSIELQPTEKGRTENGMENGKEVEETTADVGKVIPKTAIPRHGNVSTTRTLMNFFRGMVGPGCLSLPVAFKECGLWLGFAMILILGYLNAYCMMLLVKSSQYLSEKCGRGSLDYGHVAKKAFDYGPTRLRKYSKIPLYFTNTAIAAMQLGVGSVLMVFMAVHIKEVLEESGLVTEIYSLRIYLCMILLPVILINFIRELHVLGILSTLANITMIIAFAIILYQLFAKRGTVDLPAAGSIRGVLLGVGSMLYAFEGQAMILPMENKMEQPKAMRGWNGALYTGMACVSCLYAASGFFGYVTYRDDVRGSVAENLPNTYVNYGVKVLLILSFYVSYAIQLYVVIEMIWPAIRTKFLRTRSSFSQIMVELGFRTCMALVTFTFAIAIPDLEEIIPLVGISCGMTLAFIVPSTIDTVTFWEDWVADNADRKWIIVLKVLRNFALFALGVFGLIAGMTFNIQKIAE